jgi:N-hydroxyarylamine O-acetyltransferase
MEQQTVDAYLDRIGATRTSSLAELQERHLATVPFENLSIHLGEPIVLDEDALVDKIVRRRRGGFCYEVNIAFGALLRSLGYDVDLLGAKVFSGDGSLSPLFDHLALRAGDFLVDVGFGRFTRHPLRLDVRDEQHDPEGTFRIVESADGDLDVLTGGEPTYRLERRPRTVADFVPTCWYQQTSPDAHFTRNLVCTLLTDTGRITLSGNNLIVTAHGKRTEATLPDDDLLDAYRAHFGIELDRLPRLR